MVPYSATGQNLFIDYLIVSKYGIFLIKLLNLKQRFSGLKGREHGEYGVSAFDELHRKR